MASTQKTILVVDDDSVTRRLLVRTLTAAGYQLYRRNEVIIQA